MKHLDGGKSCQGMGGMLRMNFLCDPDKIYEGQEAWELFNQMVRSHEDPGTATCPKCIETAD